LQAAHVFGREPNRDAWEIRALGIVVGRVLKTASGFHALRPGRDDDYNSVGTFISLETAARALRQSPLPRGADCGSE
jgi:hypothetical protein